MRFLLALVAVIVGFAAAAAQEEIPVRIVTSAKTPGIARIETTYPELRLRVTNDAREEIEYRVLSDSPRRIKVEGKGPVWVEAWGIDWHRDLVVYEVRPLPMGRDAADLALAKLAKTLPPLTRKLRHETRAYFFHRYAESYRSMKTFGDADGRVRYDHAQLLQLAEHAEPKYRTTVRAIASAIQRCERDLQVDGHMPHDRATQFYYTIMQGFLGPLTTAGTRE